MLATVALVAGCTGFSPRAGAPQPWQEHDWAALQRALSARTAVLVLETGPKSSTAWLIDREQVRRRELAPAAALQAAADRYLARLRLEPGPGTFLPTFEAARALSRELLGEWEALLLDAAYDLLTVVPDPILADVPFCALALGPETPSSAEDVIYVGPGAGVATVVAPSLAELFALGTGKPRATERPTPNTALLVGARGDLAWVKDELGDVEKLLSGHRTRVVFDEAGATALRTLDQGAAPAILHVAAHGTTDETGTRPLLHFGNETVRAEELAGLTRAPELVNLSACHSDSGGGFRRAFLDAGARFVITSRWRLGDRAAAVLNTFFYGQLSEGPVIAMHRARSMIRNLHPAPFYWATSRLTGTTLGPRVGPETMTNQAPPPVPPGNASAPGRLLWGLLAAGALVVFVFAISRWASAPGTSWTGEWSFDGEATYQSLQQQQKESQEEGAAASPLTLFRLSVAAGMARTLEGTLVIQEDGSFEAQLEAPDGRPLEIRGQWTVNDQELVMTAVDADPPVLRGWREGDRLFVGTEDPMYVWQR